MSTKKLITIVAFVSLVALIGGLALQVFVVKKPTSSIQENPLILVTQTVYLSKDKPLTSSIQVAKGATALSLLANNMDIVVQGQGVGTFVTKIGSIMADPNKKEFWSFEINGKMAPVGAGAYILQNGDSIVWLIKNY